MEIDRDRERESVRDEKERGEGKGVCVWGGNVQLCVYMYPIMLLLLRTGRTNIVVSFTRTVGLLYL